jgi:hypothetical protein
VVLLAYHLYIGTLPLFTSVFISNGLANVVWSFLTVVHRFFLSSFAGTSMDFLFLISSKQYPNQHPSVESFHPRLEETHLWFSNHHLINFFRLVALIVLSHLKSSDRFVIYMLLLYRYHLQYHCSLTPFSTKNLLYIQCVLVAGFSISITLCFLIERLNFIK